MNYVAHSIFASLLTIASISPQAYATEFDKEGLTPLHRAAGEGDIAKLRELLPHESPLTLDQKMGVSVLHKAVYSGNAEAVRLVLVYGGSAIVNLQSPSNGNTPLHDSIYFKGKDWSVLKMLLKYGANVRVKNLAGITPMAAAASLFSDKEPLELMSEAEKKFYPLSHSELMVAVKKNDLANVKRLVSMHKEIKLSSRDENGFTPLIWAAREGFLEMVEYLISEGAEPNQLDEWMQANAGHKAAFWGRADVMKVLIKNGLAIDSRGGYNGYTALHDAIVRGHSETAKVLLDAGANCFVEGHDRKTPYSIAIQKENQIILRHGQCQIK
jgi:ankyrin repeat protein